MKHRFFNFVIDDETRKALRRLSRASAESKAQVVRRLICQAAADERNTEPPIYRGTLAVILPARAVGEVSAT